MKRPHFHRWKYLYPEHRICSTCGDCQYFYRPPTGLFKAPGSDQPEYIVDPSAYWKTCLVDELEKHIAETKAILEKQKLKEEASRARAFELLRTSNSAPTPEICGNCGARNLIEANFCTVCGRALH